MSEQEHLKKLIEKHQRRLRVLKEKKALYGLETPASILTEIEDIEAEIEDVQAELKSSGEISIEAEDLRAIQQEYFDYLIREYKDHVIRGFSPRVSGRDVSLPLAKIFLPLQAVEGRPALAEYAEEDLFRQTVTGGIGELEWQRHTLDMEKRSARLGARQAAQRPLNLAELLDSRRAVLLGDPGSGKTTVTRYITYAIAANDPTHLGSGLAELTPVLVRLANYGQALERDGTLHLVEYIAQELTSKPEFGQLLRQAIEAGTCLVILDGLDEVADPNLRIRVTERIQTMVAGYNRNRFLVTSRIVGYDRSPLTREFKHATLRELRLEDQARFVELWYEALRAEISGEAHQGQAADLVEALRTKPQIGRLAANPLLLTIMVLMHWRGVKLPNRRVEIYQNATDTLIEYWTTHREGLGLDAYEVKAILAPIAHHILSSNVSGVIGHHELLPRFHQKIAEQRGCDVATARRLGRDLLKALGEQSGIFLERGLDANGQPVYGFLHQTFGEYLAALHLADEILSDTFVLGQYIHRSMWHEPILLLAGHLSLVSQTHVSLLIRQILDFGSPYEEQLQRDLLLATDCLADDIQLKPALRQEILTKLAALLRHQAPQVREEAVKRFQSLAVTRHRELVSSTLLESLQGCDIDKLDPEVRFIIAQALIYLGECDAAKPFLWPLETERYLGKIALYKVQRLRFEGWPEQAADYLLQLQTEKRESLYYRGLIHLTPNLNLPDFMLGPIDAETARRTLGEENLLELIATMFENATDRKDRDSLRLLSCLVPQPPAVEDLAELLSSDISAEIRCLTAIQLLESDHRSEAIAVLQELIATEPEQAPAAALALVGIGEVANLDWSLLRDTALIGDQENASLAIVTLFEAGEVELAVPAALHLLSVYPPEASMAEENRLWPVVEALLEHNYLAVGLSAARWLALLPGYSARLAACEALLDAGQVEAAIPLLQYLAYECHDESGHLACQRLLLLKEVDRVIPLLTQVSCSAVAEMCYQACSALALTNQTPDAAVADVSSRVDLKLSILDERTQAYQAAMRDFYQAGLEALATLEPSSEQANAAQSIARLGLNLLIEGRVTTDQTELIDHLLNHTWPAIAVNAALFDLRAGRVDRARTSLVSLLFEADPGLSLPVRLKAMNILGEIVSPDTTRLLTQALLDKDPRVRRLAARRLGPLGDLGAVPLLINVLTDKDEAMRLAAINSLGSLGDQSAIQVLNKIFRDPDSSDELRFSAANNLIELKAFPPVEELIPGLADQNPMVRLMTTVMFVVGEFKVADAIQPLQACLTDEVGMTNGYAAMALCKLDKQVGIQALLSLMANKDPNVRIMVAQALQEFKDTQLLIRKLKDDNSNVRATAALALGHLKGDLAVINSLIDALHDVDNDVRGAAAQALGQLGDLRAVQPLVLALGDEEGGVRSAAAEALGKLADPTVVEKILLLLNDDDSAVRTAAAKALAEFNDSIAMNPLLATIHDDHFGVRVSVATALAKLGNHDAILYFQPLLKSQSPNIIDQVARAFGEFGDPIINPSLLTVFIDQNRNHSRASIFTALARLKATEALPLLIAYSTASSDTIAISNGTALIHLDPASALLVLQRYCRQFPYEPRLIHLQGQAYWQLQQLDVALNHFSLALQTKRNIENLLALTHFYIEQDNLQTATHYIHQALQNKPDILDQLTQEEDRDEQAVTLLTQAIIEWQLGNSEQGLTILKQARRKHRRVINIKNLKYDHFWRQKAITALDEMLMQLQ